MQWIRHHNPDLVTLDDAGNVVKRFDLNGYTEERLEKLMEREGFKKKF